MPKMKTKKALSKRIICTANGFKRKQSHRSHLASCKSTKRKRQLKKSLFLNSHQLKKIEHLLQG